MGTDIHPIVQRRVNGEWQRVPLPVEDDDKYSYYRPLKGRRYLLFAILADVRNGFGFAGCPTHKPIIPISDARGLPNDFDTDCLVDHKPEECDDKWCDHVTWLGDHSLSWVTLGELNSYQWDQTLTTYGILGARVYEEWMAEGRKGNPRGWSGGVSGPGIVIVQEEEYSASKTLVPHDRLHVRCEWDIPISEALGEFYTVALPWLRTLGEPQDVRIVFGFDS